METDQALAETRDALAAGDTDRARDAFGALDTMLSNGAPLPLDWQGAR